MVSTRPKPLRSPKSALYEESGPHHSPDRPSMHSSLSSRPRLGVLILVVTCAPVSASRYTRLKGASSASLFCLITLKSTDPASCVKTVGPMGREGDEWYHGEPGQWDAVDWART